MHGITQYDKVETTEKTWHGLEVIKPKLEFVNGALDWQVEQVQVYGDDGQPLVEVVLDKQGNEVERPFLAIKAGELTLGIAKETYQTIQNKELFEAVQILIDEFGFKLATMGSIYGRKRVFMSLENDDSDLGLDDDRIDTRLNVTSSHDGTIKASFFNSAIRIVCGNTFRFSLGYLKEQMEEDDFKGFFSFAKHTKNAGYKLDNIKQGLVSFYAQKEAIKDGLMAMQSVSISSEEALAASVGYIANDKISTKSHNQALTVQSLFARGKGNRGKSVYDLFNGFTEFYTHEASEDKEKLYLSSEHGVYANKKEELFSLLASQDETSKLIEQGEALLATL